MNLLEQLNIKCEVLLRKTCATLLMLFSAIVVLQVVSRNYIKISIPWTDEVALICFVWGVFLGSAVAVRTKQHYVVDIFPSKMERTNMFLSCLANILIMAVIFVIIKGGIRFTEMGLARFCTSIPICQAFLFASMPISGIFMFLFNVENIIKDALSFKKLMKGEVA